MCTWQQTTGCLQLLFAEKILRVEYSVQSLLLGVLQSFQRLIMLMLLWQDNGWPPSLNRKDATAFIKAVKRYGLEIRLPQIAAEVGPVMEEAPEAAKCAPRYDASECHALCLLHIHLWAQMIFRCCNPCPDGALEASSGPADLNAERQRNHDWLVPACTHKAASPAALLCLALQNLKSGKAAV